MEILFISHTSCDNELKSKRPRDKVIAAWHWTIAASLCMRYVATCHILLEILIVSHTSSYHLYCITLKVEAVNIRWR